MKNYLNHLVNLLFSDFPFYMILTRFCEKLKVVSSDISIIKYIVAPLSLSSLPIKLICCVKSDFSNSMCFA